MRISVKAKPGAKVAQIKEIGGHLHIAVTERATEGRANRAIEKAIAKHFGVAPSCVRIISGLTSKTKVVEISS
jgi:uncharacterized protein YggU (UPF0235/DUF167 family)